ncbi:MAG: hypothetical protein ACM65M_07095 [Microcoleus sp.]
MPIYWRSRSENYDQKTVNGEWETADQRRNNTDHNRQLNTHRSP